MSTTKPEIIQWDTHVPGAPAIPVVPMEHPDQVAPEGFPVQVEINRAGHLDDSLVSQVSAKAAGGPDGIIQAAMFLEEQLGYTCTRPECIRAVKEMRGKMAAGRSSADLRVMVPMRQLVFMSEQSFEKVKDLPGVEATEERYRSPDRTPAVESAIEWPEDYTGGVLDPTADADGAGGESYVDAPPPTNGPGVRRSDGVLTQISSMPAKQTPGPKPAFAPPKRGVRR